MAAYILPGTDAATKAPTPTASTFPKFGIPVYPYSRFRLRLMIA